MVVGDAVAKAVVGAEGGECRDRSGSVVGGGERNEGKGVLSKVVVGSLAVVGARGERAACCGCSGPAR